MYTRPAHKDRGECFTQLGIYRIRTGSNKNGSGAFPRGPAQLAGASGNFLFKNNCFFSILLEKIDEILKNSIFLKNQIFQIFHFFSKNADLDE